MRQVVYSNRYRRQMFFFAKTNWTEYNIFRPGPGILFYPLSYLPAKPNARRRKKNTVFAIIYGYAYFHWGNFECVLLNNIFVFFFFSFSLSMFALPIYNSWERCCQSPPQHRRPPYHHRYHIQTSRRPISSTTYRIQPKDQT